MEKVKKMLSPAYSLKLTNIILFFNRGLFSFKKWSYQNVISTLSNVAKIDVENSNFVSKLSNVVQFYVEKRNVVSTLFNAVNFNVDVHNVALMLIWRCATSRRHINLKTMLNRRWNVCWVNFMVNTLKKTQLEQHLQSYNSMIIYIHGLKQFECVLQKKLIANLRKSISISVLLSKIELYEDIIVS